MASKADIWMPLYIGDYLADTSHLSTEEHGAYMLMLMHYWKQGPLPNDDRVLAQITRLSFDAWSNARVLLIAFFSVGNDGLLHQKRSDEEKGYWIAKQQKANEKATKAAKTRWKREPQGDAPSNASEKHEECPSPSPSPIKPYSAEIEDDAIDATMAFRALIELTGINTQAGRIVLDRMAAKAERDRKDLKLWVEKMAEAWRVFVEARPKLKYAWGAEKFFGEGHHEDPAGWPWKDGHSPPANSNGKGNGKKYWKPEH